MQQIFLRRASLVTYATREVLDDKDGIGVCEAVDAKS